MQDITRALLAFHRQGLVGLGQSALGTWLVPGEPSLIRRGELVYERLLQYLGETINLGIHESVHLLVGELQHQLPPADQYQAEGLSLSEYYRRRREAISVLLDLLVQ